MDVNEEIYQGLIDYPRHLPTRLLYDARGAALFEAITKQPEYYATRDEDEILRNHADDIARYVPSGGELVELGSGDGHKAGVLLKALKSVAYIGVDVACEQLQGLTARMYREHPGVGVAMLCEDFEKMKLSPPRHARLGVFLGGTLGNYADAEAIALLANVRRALGKGSRLLVGVARPGNGAVIHAAYNDIAGVTADFNKNILLHINRLTGADFDTWYWTHVAVYNDTQQRVEMYLEARERHKVVANDWSVAFDKGERICTEWSYRYNGGLVSSLAEAAGWRHEAQWEAVSGMTALVLLKDAL